jgi:hypothetical protein
MYLELKSINYIIVITIGNSGQNQQSRYQGSFVKNFVIRLPRLRVCANGIKLEKQTFS